MKERVLKEASSEFKKIKSELDIQDAKAIISSNKLQ